MGSSELLRPITAEEREDLCRRAGSQDIVDFVYEVQWLSRKHRIPQFQMLAILLRVPQETDISEVEFLGVRNQLAEQGFELTPDEVVDTMEKAMCKIRNYLRSHGVPESEIPASDVEFRDKYLGRST